MKTIKNEIRPVGYVTLELSELEIQTIYDLFWQIGEYRDMPPAGFLGKKGELYKQFEELLNLSNKL